MTLDECERVFDAAKASHSENDFRAAIAPLLQNYELLSLGLGRSNIFWRARIVESAPYEHIDELDYPPPTLAKQGRLNDAGDPCFYVSTRQETALAEVGAPEGCMVQIAGFRVLHERPIRVAVVGEYSNVQKNGYMHFAGSDPDLTIARKLNALPRAEGLRTIYIDRFFADVLADTNASSNGYLHSRALAKAIYEKIPADGIAFPSVRDRGGFNVAVKAEPSDESFHNVCCLLVKVGKPRRFGLRDFEVMNSAERLQDGKKFVWYDPPSSELLGMYNMTKEEYEFSLTFPDKRNGMLAMLNMHRRQGR